MARLLGSLLFLSSLAAVQAGQVTAYFCATVGAPIGSTPSSDQTVAWRVQYGSPSCPIMSCSLDESMLMIIQYSVTLMRRMVAPVKARSTPSLVSFLPLHNSTRFVATQLSADQVIVTSVPTERPASSVRPAYI